MSAVDETAAPTGGSPSHGRRAVVLVGNPAAPYSRALKVGRALAARGFATEIAAIAAAGLPRREADGELSIERYAPSGLFARLGALFPGAGLAPAADPGEQVSAAPAPSPAQPSLPAGTMDDRATALGLRDKVARVVARFSGRAAALLRWLLWPHTVRGWWATLWRELPPAHVYHACGSLTIAPALRARSRDRRAGRRSVVIYDAIDDVFESNNVLGMPAPIRAWHAYREARWARSSDARLTVNDALAERLPTRWRTVDPPLVVPNYAEPWSAPAERPDLIRRQLGLSPTTRVVLFQGRLGPNLGLDEAAEAILLVPDAVLVLIGFGRWLARCQARDRDPRYVGRHVTLGARHPDTLPVWTASADVALVPLPPVSYNQRHATPNKFWEAIAVGTPVVVGPDLPVMDTLVKEADLGVVATSLSPEPLASAIRDVIDRSPRDRAAWRARITATARERFSWPAAAERYRALIDELTASDATGRA